MTYLKSIVLLMAFSVPSFCFSQSGLSKIIGITNTVLTQDTAKPKSGTSNLAVTDEGAKGDKSKTSKTADDNSLKKDVTPNAVKTTTITGGTTNNLAVTDEGAAGDKPKTKTNKEAGTGTTQGESKAITPK